MIFFVHVRGHFQANLPFDQFSFVATFVVEFPMPSWVCQWKPFWIPVGESFKKAFLEEWIFVGDDSSDEQGFTNFPVLLHSNGNTDYTRDDDPPTPRPARQPGPQDKAYFSERNEAPLPPQGPRCNFTHPRQLSPFPECLELPFSSDEILSSYEDIVSPGTGFFIRMGQDEPSQGPGTSYG